MTIFDGFGFALVLLLIAISGFKRAADRGDYLVASRQLGFFPLMATLVMTEFNTSTLFAFAGIGYMAGPMALSLPLVFLIGLGWYTVSVAKKWKKLNGLSVAELFTEKFGRPFGRLASGFLIFAMLGFSATYIKSLSLLFGPFFPTLSTWLLSASIAAVAAFITFRGGMRSIVRSDIVSFIFKIIFLPLLLFIGISKFGKLSSLVKVFPADQLGVNPIGQWNNASLPFWFVLTLIIITMFTYICSPWYGQKIFAARSEKVAFWATGASALVVFFLYGSIVLAAAYFRMENQTLKNPETVVPQMMTQWFPPLLRGMGFAILFSTSLTALTGMWSALVAMVIADFQSKKIPAISVQRMMMIFFATSSWLAANILVDDILKKLILANIPIAALSFALLGGFYWSKTSPAGAWLSSIFGVLWGIGCYLKFGEAGGYTWYWAIYGIPLIFIVGTSASWLFPRVHDKPAVIS